MRGHALFLSASIFFAISCGPPTEPVEAPVAPRTDTQAPEEAPPPLLPAEERGWTGSSLECAKRRLSLRAPSSSTSLAFDAIEFLNGRGEREAGRAPFVGISAPRPPPEVRIRTHVRRRAVASVAGVSLDEALARAIDAAPLDTSACMQREGRAADLVVVLTAGQGAAKELRVQASELDDATRCIVEAACDLALPDAHNDQRGAFGLRIRPLRSDRAKIDVMSSGNASDAKVVAAVVEDVATGCEQGQLLTRDVRYVDIGASGTPHSTVRPTMIVGRTGTSQPSPDESLIRCLETRLDGYRLPFDPSHQVNPITFRVTWSN
jgi:hypothetical protein